MQRGIPDLDVTEMLSEVIFSLHLQQIDNELNVSDDFIDVMDKIESKVRTNFTEKLFAPEADEIMLNSSEFFKRLVSFYSKTDEKIIEIFPDCGKKYCENILSNIDDDLANPNFSLYKLRKRLSYSTEYKQKILEKITEKINIEPTILDSFINGLLSLENLKELHEYLPKTYDIIYKNIILSPNIFGWIVNSTEDIDELLKMFPEHKDEIFSKLSELSGLSDCWKIFNYLNELDKTLNFFPNQNREIFKTLLSRPDPFYLLKNINDLIQFIHLFPDYKSEIYEKLITDSNLFRILQQAEDLIKFIDIFPGSEDKLFEKLLSRVIPIDAISTEIKELMQKYQELNQRITDKFTKIFPDRIIGIDNFIKILEIFPRWRNRVYEEFLSEQDSVGALFKNLKQSQKISYDYMPCTWLCNKLLQYFPESKNEIAKKLLSETTLFGLVIESLADTKGILEIFPNYKDRFLDEFLSQSQIGSTWPTILLGKNYEQYYESTLDDLLTLFPHRKFELAQNVLSDGSYFRVQFERNRKNYQMDNLISRFPEYKSIFNIVTELMVAIADRSAKSIEVIHNKIKTEVNDSNDLLLLSRSLNEENCFFVRDALNINVKKHYWHSEFVNQLNLLHEYLANLAFHSLTSHAVSVINKQGIFANKTRAVKLESNDQPINEYKFL